MVRELFGKTGEIRGMHEAAYLLAAFALLSQILALFRDRLFAAQFGASHTLDIYYAAFRIPDLLFATVASLLSLYALMPILTQLLEKREEYVVAFLRQTLLVFFVAIGVIAAVLFLLTPFLVSLIAPGVAEGAARDDLVLLVRILLLQPILLGASNILASLTQLKHRFFLYSVSPLLYNLGIIFGIVALYPLLGIAGLAWGVVMGAMLHMAIQLPFFTTARSEKLPPGIFFPNFLNVLQLSIPRTLALASGQLVLLVLIALASYLSKGSIAVFMFAWNLQAVPLTMIGVSYSVAAFPTLARLHAAGQWKEFVEHLEVALRHILFWAIPATILMIVLRAQIVRIILGSGVFDWNDTRLVAAALALFVVSLCAQSVTLLIARAYYAAGRTAMPLYLSLAGVGVSIASALVLVGVFHELTFARLFLESLLRVSDIPGTTVLMLALAYCVGALVQAGLGVYYLSRDFAVSLAGLRRLAFHSFAAGVLGGALCYETLAIVGELVDIDTAVGILLQGLAGGVVGLVITVATLALLKNKELAEALSALKRRFKDSQELTLESTEVS